MKKFFDTAAEIAIVVGAVSGLIALTVLTFVIALAPYIVIGLGLYWWLA